MAKYRKNSQDTWKTLKIKALDSMPIGTIMQYAGETIPNGWLLCNGDAVATTEYPDLYNAIGTRYGGTSDNFRLPDFRGRVAVGVNLSDEDFDTLGNFGGSKELQEHTHNLRYSNGGAVGVGGYTTTSSSYVYDTSAGSIESAGTGDSGNLQPYLVVNYIIKAFSVVPTMRGITNNYSTSTKDGYSCDYVNNNYFSYKVLWENPNPTSSFASQNITLNSSDYNYISIEYCLFGGSGYRQAMATGKMAYSTNGYKLDFTDFHGTRGIVGYTRTITPLSKTSYSVSDATAFWSVGTETSNNHALPLKIIGYK